MFDASYCCARYSDTAAIATVMSSGPSHQH